MDAEVVFRNEVRAIETLCDGSHENIITVFRHGRLKTRHAIYFIDMEWCDTSLEDYMSGNKYIPGLLDWSKAGIRGKIHYLLDGIMTNVLNGLIYIHDRNEVHRDLTPANG